MSSRVKSSQVVTNGGYEQVVSDVSEAREVDVVLQIWTLGMAGRCWEAGVPGFLRDGILWRGWLKTYDIWHFDTWHFNDTLDFDTSWFIDLGYDWLWSILSKTTSLLKATVLGPARVRIHTLTYLGACEMTTTLFCECHVVTWGHHYCTVIYIPSDDNHCHFIGCRIFGQSNLYRTLGSMIFPCMEDFQVFFLPQESHLEWSSETRHARAEEESQVLLQEGMSSQNCSSKASSSWAIWSSAARLRDALNSDAILHVSCMSL